MPDRIVDNLLAPKAKVSVVNWDKAVADPSYLSYLIDVTHADRASCVYDLSRPLRRANSS